MADKVRLTFTVEYPLGSPESYGGETDPRKQLAMERQYADEEGDYLLAVIDLDETETTVIGAELV